MSHMSDVVMRDKHCERITRWAITAPFFFFWGTVFLEQSHHRHSPVDDTNMAARVLVLIELEVLKFGVHHLMPLLPPLARPTPPQSPYSTPCSSLYSAAVTALAKTTH